MDGWLFDDEPLATFPALHVHTLSSHPADPPKTCQGGGAPLGDIGFVGRATRFAIAIARVTHTEVLL